LNKFCQAQANDNIEEGALRHYLLKKIQPVFFINTIKVTDFLNIFWFALSGY